MVQKLAHTTGPSKYRLPDEVLEYRELVYDFALREIRPSAEKRDLEGIWDPELWKKMAKIGLVGLSVPQEYGGSGASCLMTAVAHEAFAEGSADGGLTLALGAHAIIGTMPIVLLGTKEQKEKYLPKLASGEWIAGLGLTEPGAGSDAAGSMQTRAVRKGDRYILNGSKMFITNGPIGDVFVVMAVTDKNKGAFGISAFIVEKTFKGFSVGKKLNKMGMRTSTTSELIFEDMEVPVENRICEENAGFLRVGRATLEWERTVLVAAGIGAMKSLLQEGTRYAKERIQFGEPIIRFQAIQDKIARTRYKLDAARLLIYQSAMKKDRGEPAPIESSIAKLYTTESNVEVSYDIGQIFGGYAYIHDYPVERAYRDARLSTIGAGTSEVMRSIIAANTKELWQDADLEGEEKEAFNAFCDFCEKEIAPHVAAVDKAGEVPRSHFEKLYQVGYTGAMHEEEYGGSNCSYFYTTHLQEALAAACGSTFFSVGASVGLFGLPLREYGSREQKQKYLPDIIRGKTIGALAVTEPHAGSDVSAIQSKAVYRNGKFYLTGSKTYITNAPVCDHALVLAVVEKDGKRIGQTVFIVDAHAQGVVRGKPMEKLGLKGSPTGELFFDGVELTETDILGKIGRGFAIIMSAFNRERLALAAYAVGVMAAAIRHCRKYAKERKAFGKPIIKHQAVAFMLADMITRYEAARQVLHETAWLMDQAQGASQVEHNGEIVDLSARTASLKLMASTYAREVTNWAVQIFGGAGYIEDYPVARLYRDVKLAEIGGGTSEIMKAIVAHAEAKRVARR
ncbi:MAG: acyl-CoA dehydrogenase family protein [Turneriella sp.]|nr:acyl-CoA dehydrogenase family protein [Leptospiraceae bacterium]MCX7632028.1 acyl-CoA dehydrogenase family protein [Turneriella sp.]